MPAGTFFAALSARHCAPHCFSRSYIAFCAALGWPHGDQADIARAWRRILGRVHGYTDLEPSLLGRVEQLIDFTTAS